MITREEYYRIIRKHFSFLIEKYNFREILKETQNSMLYDLEYTDKKRIVSISYEIMGEGVNIIIFKVIDGIRSEYDDYKNTIHLNSLLKGTQKANIVKRHSTRKSMFKHSEITEIIFEKEVVKKADLLLCFMETTVLK